MLVKHDFLMFSVFLFFSLVFSQNNRDSLNSVRINTENQIKEKLNEMERVQRELELLEQEHSIKSSTRDVIVDRHPNGMKKTIIVYKGEGKYEQIVKKLEYYDNGQLNKYFQWENENPNGIYKEFFRTGELNRKGILINGINDGKRIDYFRDGGIKSLSYHDNGKPIGKWIYFYESGAIKMEIRFRQRNQDDIAVMTQYLENNLVLSKISTNLTTGQAHGITTEYYDNGQLKTRIFHSMKPKGRHEEYFKDGKPKLIYTLKDNKFVGDFLICYNNGNIHQKTYYNKFGEIEGSFEAYKEDGTPMLIFTRKNSKYNGEYLSYYDNGQLKETINYTNGVKDGGYTSYYNNGKIEKISFYLNGKTHGKYLHFSEDGKLLEELTYEFGKEIR